MAIKAHHTWLSNHLDRKALLHIVDNASIMYEEVLAEQCRALFGDTLDSVKSQLDAECDEDDDAGPEAGGCAAEK